MQNLKKYSIYLIILIFVISIVIYFFIPYLAYTASKDVQKKDFAHAAKINNLLGNITTDSLKKGNYYLTAGDCYIELKDIANAIKAYEKAEKHIQILGEFEKNRLTDLYIINKDYEKAAVRGAGYKADILQNNWEEALNKLNSEIENPQSGQLVNEKIYAPYDKYLARAIVYKNLNQNTNAQKDFATALMLEPSKESKIETIYKNKNYYKEYYGRIEKAFQ